MIRTTVLLLPLALSLSASAQGTGDSPYSAYGFGDQLSTAQVSQALMAGTGLSILEPFSVAFGNPASYAALVRPVFEAGVVFRNTRSSSSTTNTSHGDANFTGFSFGVPFGKGKWGMALGLTPFSDVGYSTVKSQTFEGDGVKYEYTGNGGLNRAFFGLGRSIYQERSDSLGNSGSRILVGADFNFFFGSIEQTRDAVYPAQAGYSNLRSFSSLVLRSPTGDASLVWQGDLTKKKTRDGDNWRWSVGASASFPTRFNARYSNLVTSYVTSSGTDIIRDTISNTEGLKGTVVFPVFLGLGIGIQNQRWAFTTEMKQRDWSRTNISVPGYELPAPLRGSTTYSAAIRFQPSYEGNLFHRMVYRTGFRHTDEPLQVHGEGLSADVYTLGVSLPLNAYQTNSWINIGGEFGQRGNTDNGLIQERYAMLWVGFTFTPWRGERWFAAPKIQ